MSRATTLFLRRDIYHGGPSGVSGVVTELLVPGQYCLCLHDELTRHLVRQVWSNTSGEYQFSLVSSDPKYIVAFDHTSPVRNAVIKDNVVPSLIGTIVNLDLGGGLVAPPGSERTATFDTTEARDSSQASGSFVAYSGPGFINSTERGDVASAAGVVVYNVSGTLNTEDSRDGVSIVASIREYLELDFSDVLYANDAFTGEVSPGGLLSLVGVVDSLTESPDFSVADILKAADSLSGQIAVSFFDADVVGVVDSLGAHQAGDLSDSVGADDALGTASEALTEDVVGTTDGLTGYLQVSAALADSIRASDRVIADIGGFLADSIGSSDEVAGHVQSYAAFSDLVAAGNILTGTLALSANSIDGVVASESMSQMWLAAGGDSIAVSDTLTGAVAVYAPLADSFQIVDALLGTSTAQAPTLAGSLGATDSLTGALQLIGVLSDVGLAGDSLYESAQVIYVTNAETGAVSTYTMTPVVKGAAFFQGTLYLAGPDGLYAVDAEQDEDGAIVWTLQTGFSDFGTDLLKRVRDVNVQGRTEGDTTLQVTEARGGRKQEWSYRLPPQTRESYRDGVVKPGKGIHSVYYGLGLRGTGPAEIDKLRVVIEPLSRRR